MHSPLTEIGDLSNYDSASAVSADAGLSPSMYQSGTSIKRNPKLSKLGKASLRAAFYFPAITAMKFNPVIQSFAYRLKTKHKPSKVIIVAVMRKLLHIAYGVIKNNTPFDPFFAKT
ncbi:MAG: IS110 family transposase [Trueperaceae bacterium]|nr:IS110 family transposase [Trueperaceae bacterium]